MDFYKRNVEVLREEANKSVQEGRIIEVEAMQIALMLLSVELTGKELVPLHKVAH
jgi:hypothetical protein